MKKISVKQSLKHVVNVIHRQKLYLDYLCKVVVSFFFSVNEECYLHVKLRDSDCKLDGCER